MIGINFLGRPDAECVAHPDSGGLNWVDYQRWGVVVGPPRDLCEMSLKPEHYRLTKPIKAISGNSKVIWVKKTNACSGIFTVLFVYITLIHHFNHLTSRDL